MKLTRKRISGLALVALMLAGAGTSFAQEPPLLRVPDEQTNIPDLSGLQRMRFLTSLDFPPFNFADQNKLPTGFNVDLARAICSALQIDAKCEIQAMPWGELEPSLLSLRGEAIIAGTAVSRAAREEFALSEPYFRFAGRFLARKADPLDLNDNSVPKLRGKTLGVVEKSAHAAMAEDYFADGKITPFPDMPALYEALKNGEVDYAFADGPMASFWLSADKSEDCCRFVGSPWFSEKYFGGGMAIALRWEDRSLLTAINSALAALERDGTIARIFARYFPVDPFAPTSGD